LTGPLARRARGPHVGLAIAHRQEAGVPDSPPPPRARVGSLRLILPYLAAYRWRVAGAVVALIGAVVLVLAVGQGLRRLVDQGFASGSAENLNTTALLMFGIVAALAVATAARFYLVTWLGERIADAATCSPACWGCRPRISRWRGPATFFRASPPTSRCCRR
jgi:hypothetical protein